MEQEHVSFLFREFSLLHLVPTEEQVRQFLLYYDELIRVNEYINLTAITEFHEVVEKHFLDSLSICYIFSEEQMRQEKMVLDLGSGAGFPGIPLKIMFPEMTFVLLDSMQKRVGFLNNTIKLLGLKNICAVHGRAEEFGRDEQYREKFDWCISRAVASLPTLAEYCLPFVKPGGYFISYKGEKARAELDLSKEALHVLKAKVENIVSFSLGENTLKRTLIAIQKTGIIGKTYPRGGGKPKSDPLGCRRI